MNIDIHIPDQYLTRLADMVAERLQGISDDRLGEFLNNRPAPGYPAPAEPETLPEEPPVVVSTTKAPKPDTKPVTIDEVRKHLAGMDRGKAVALLQKHGASKLSDLPVEKYADLMGEAA